MINQFIHIAVDIIDEYYSKASTAFLTEYHEIDDLIFIKIIILDDTYTYQTLETLRIDNKEIEIEVFPKYFLALANDNFNVLEENKLFKSISEGYLIRDKNAVGEKLQQMYEVISKKMDYDSSLNIYEDIFYITKLINRFKFTESITNRFVLKTEIFVKIVSLLNGKSNRNDFIENVHKNFDKDEEFQKTVHLILNDFGGAIQYYSKNLLYNNLNENKISILIEGEFSFDDFLSDIILFILKKIKSIGHEIKFAFKAINRTSYLLTIWTDKKNIQQSIIPIINSIILNSPEAQKSIKFKYPYKDKREKLYDLFLPANLIIDFKVKLSYYLFESKFNDDQSFSEGYRLSLGIHFVIEILKKLITEKNRAKKTTNILFENWLSLSFDTDDTCYSDLEFQSHKVLNDFENLYLNQFNSLFNNFNEPLKTWDKKEETIDGFGELIKSIIDYTDNEININNYFSKNDFITEFLIFETLDILGVSNYNKSYIIYCINRLLNEA